MKRSAWRYLWKSQDIRRKLLVTLFLLVIYRLASNVPVSGIDETLVATLTQTWLLYPLLVRSISSLQCLGNR